MKLIYFLSLLLILSGFISIVWSPPIRSDNTPYREPMRYHDYDWIDSMVKAEHMKKETVKPINQANGNE